MTDQDTTAANSEPGAGSTDERNWAVIAHLSGLVGFMIPFGNILGPLIVWLIQRDQKPFVDDQAREALNFQITMSITFAVAAALIFVVIGILLLPVVVLIDVILIVMAAVDANKGNRHRYPFNLRLIK